MSALEYCGIAFLVLVFMLACTAVYLWSFGPVDLFDDKQTQAELDALILRADVAKARAHQVNRPRVRAGISQNI